MSLGDAAKCENTRTSMMKVSGATRGRAGPVSMTSCTRRMRRLPILPAG